jgi:hypothetical protein
MADMDPGLRRDDKRVGNLCIQALDFVPLALWLTQMVPLHPAVMPGLVPRP